MAPRLRVGAQHLGVDGLGLLGPLGLGLGEGVALDALDARLPVFAGDADLGLGAFLGCELGGEGAGLSLRDVAVRLGVGELGVSVELLLAVDGLGDGALETSPQEGGSRGR